MIIDRTWNKNTQNYVISYIDDNGDRRIWNKYMHHWKTYEYDENGRYETWDGKRANMIFKNSFDYTPNEFDELEFLYNLKETEPELLRTLHKSNSPRTYVFDIETEFVEGEFPEPEKAEHRIVSISLVGPDLSCIVYGLHQLDETQKNTLRDRYINWINKNKFASQHYNGNIKVLYQAFRSEEEMLTHFMTRVLPKVICLTGWNTYNFDYLYLVNRIIRLFGKGEAMNMIKLCSPTREIHNMRVDDGFGNKFKIPTPKHTLWLDEMELVKQYDYALRPYESYSLDYVANKGIGAEKIKYSGSLNDLYNKDYEWYYFYNAIDSLLVMLLHYRLKCIESPVAVASLTLVPLLKAFGQVALTTANVFEEFYNDDKRVVYSRKDNVKEPYKGAFCGCIPGRYLYSVCSDFSALYPSMIRTCNISFENFVENLGINPETGKYGRIPWPEDKLEEFRKDPNYFVTVNGNVYKNDKDYAFRRVMKKLVTKRGYFKYGGNDTEAELLPYLDKLIAEKESLAA